MDAGLSSTSMLPIHVSVPLELATNIRQFLVWFSLARCFSILWECAANTLSGALCGCLKHQYSFGCVMHDYTVYGWQAIQYSIWKRIECSPELH